jgi:hypothetical protein
MNETIKDSGWRRDEDSMREPSPQASSSWNAPDGSSATHSGCNFYTIAEAAKRLSTTPAALRARCRRAARNENGQVVANLGFGIRAFKFGKRSWRICIQQL